jgi:A/G-specific adenine glycosylase
VQALAAAPLDEVLALWSGLGYYSRARNLHRCAQRWWPSTAGAFPVRSAVLATLPGIGRSTAAAIAAFCFGERCRHPRRQREARADARAGLRRRPGEAARRRRCGSAPRRCCPTAGIEAYTQGLMDLGATLCLARRPAMRRLPAGALRGPRPGAGPSAYPVKTRKLKRGTREHACCG